MMDYAYSTRKLEFQRSLISAKQKQMVRQMKETKYERKSIKLDEIQIPLEEEGEERGWRWKKKESMKMKILGFGNFWK